MSNYARANRTAAWYADNYRGSTLELAESTTVCVLHSTEGTSLPGYSGGATAPNYTALPDWDNQRLVWFAHFPDEMSGRALRNLVGGVETNTLNAVQVELVGTCDPRAHSQWKSRHIYWPEAPDWALRDLAHFLADQHRRHGLKLQGPPTALRAYPASYGNSPSRMSHDQWRKFAGVCGHQSVPENSHGDPGDLDLAKVLEYARAMVAAPADPAKPEPLVESPRWDALWELADELLKSLPETATHRRTAAARIRDTAAAWSHAH